MAAIESDARFRELALFAGAGGGILGGQLLGWRTICAVECDAYAASVLVRRQNEGALEAFPVWDDVCTFDGTLWRGRIDVISGGFPCQDISAAGKGRGIDGERSGLWREMARIISEVRPRFVFVENSPLLIQRGLAVVLADLAAMGFNAKWGIVSAQDAIWLGGNPAVYHQRERCWIVGTNANEVELQNWRQQESLERICVGKNSCAEKEQRRSIAGDDSNGDSREGGTIVSSIRKTSDAGENSHSAIGRSPLSPGERNHNAEGSDGRRADELGGASGVAGIESWWATEPKLGRVAHGVAHRVDRLACIGNGQVPIAAAIAWNILSGVDGCDD